MAIYLDAIWLLNFIFDALILLITSLILKRRILRWRLISGAFIGSLIVLLYFTPFTTLVSHPLVKLLFSVAIVFTAFGYKKFRSFLQALFMFYFVTFFIGGGLIGVHYFIEDTIVSNGGVLSSFSLGYGDSISWGFVIIAFPIILLFSKKRFEDAETRKITTDQLINLEIVIEDVTLTLRGLIDTGNQLYDPVSRDPVLILDIKKTEQQWPAQLYEQLHKWMEFEMDYTAASQSYFKRIRVIPYRSVGHNQQFIIGVKADEVRMQYKGDVIISKKAIVGLSSTTLSSEAEYDCILHPKLILASSKTA